MTEQQNLEYLGNLMTEYYKNTELKIKKFDEIIDVARKIRAREMKRKVVFRKILTTIKKREFKRAVDLYKNELPPSFKFIM